MADVETMRALLEDCLVDLAMNEDATMRRLGAIQDAATAPELKAALGEHRDVSRRQLDRLQAMAGELGIDLDGPKCLWAEAILDDGERDGRMVAPGPLLDIALAGAVRKLEASEIVSYETAIAVARTLGHHDVAERLSVTHREERDMDASLARALERAAGASSSPDAAAKRGGEDVVA